MPAFVRPLFAACLLAALLSSCDNESPEVAPPDDTAAFQAARANAQALDERDELPGKRADAWRAAVALRPAAPLMLQKFGQALLDANFQGEAAEVLGRAVELEPTHLETRQKLVNILLSLGRDDAALSLLLDTNERGLANAVSHSQLAQLKDRAGDRDAAQQLLDEAVARWPHSAGRALALRGRLSLQAGELLAAQQDFEAAVQQRPDDTTAIKGLADVARRQSDNARADHWDEVLQLLVDLTDNVILRDEASFRKPRLRRLAELHPNWVDGWRELAGHMQSAGRSQATCQFVQTQIERTPQLSPELRAQLRQSFCTESP